jgi:transposase
MIGLDLAKSVFQVHGADGTGQVVIRRQLKRGQVEKFFVRLEPAVVGMEACGGAHHWGRVLQGLGHEVRLMPAAYVKPYVKRNKTDGRDAEAICEAMQRPTMRFVAVKRPEQQAMMTVHRTRALLVRQRTMLANALRAIFAEFGVVTPAGVKGLQSLMEQLPEPVAVPEAGHEAMAMLHGSGKASMRILGHWSSRSCRACAPVKRRVGSWRFRAWVRSPPAPFWRRRRT